MTIITHLDQPPISWPTECQCDHHTPYGPDGQPWSRWLSTHHCSISIYDPKPFSSTRYACSSNHPVTLCYNPAIASPTDTCIVAILDNEARQYMTKRTSTMNKPCKFTKARKVHVRVSEIWMTSTDSCKNSRYVKFVRKSDYDKLAKAVDALYKVAMHTTPSKV